MNNTTIYQEGFNAGYKQLQVGDEKEARAKLFTALNIKNRTSFLHYRHGREGREPKGSQIIAIELIFRKYGVTSNIWGK